MNEIIENVKSTKIKLITTPKIKHHNIFTSKKPKPELRAKINCNIKEEEEKNLFINIEQNDNLTSLENKNDQDIHYVFNYEEKGNMGKNNILANEKYEKSTKTDDSSGEEKIKRKIQVQNPLNLNEKFDNNNIKKALSNKMNKYNLTLSLLSYISNKQYPNNIVSKLSKENIDNNKNDFQNKNTINKKAVYYKDHNIKKQKRKIIKEKSLTENIIYFNEVVKDNSNYNNNNLLYTQNTENSKNNCNNTETNLTQVIQKNKSYDSLKAVTIKKNDTNNEKNNNNIKEIDDINNKNNKNTDNNIDINYKNNKILAENNDVSHYIKVNKKKINNVDIKNKHKNKKEEEDDIPILNINKEIELKNKNDNINNNNKKTIKNKRNILNNNDLFDKKNNNKSKTCSNECLSNKKEKVKTIGFKKIEKTKYNNNFPINKTEQIKRKNIKIFDKNKLENNIFLDKTYQNRFKKQQKNKNLTQNDIFTSDKQKEYNTFIVKKKSNYLSNQILNGNSSNESNESNNKGWVYRLYNNEIKKQKIKDKIILLLRKSILNEKKEEKQFTKPKTTKQYNNNDYDYPIKEGYNIDDNFNIINLFLSDDKKMKKKSKSKRKKRMKRCQSYHSYRNKQQKKHGFDNNKIEDEKIGKLIDDKISLKNHRSYKKFRLLYNEELIDEEDEEKEQEKDEEEQ